MGVLLTNFKIWIFLSIFCPVFSRDERAISYILVNEMVLPNEALRICMEVYYGRLLTIFSAEQDQRIANMIQSMQPQDKIITSGKFNAIADRWEWSTTATPFGYENLSDTTLITDDTCVYKTLNSARNYEWIGYPCSTSRGVYVCEVEF